MYEEFVEDLPVLQKSTETFLIKGLKLPFYASSNTIVKVVGNYYFRKENFVLFASPCSGKLIGILEMVKSLRDYVVLTDRKTREQFDTRNICDNNIILADGFNFEESSAKFLIFYNTKIPFEQIDNNNVHISGFYDYVGLCNTKEYKSYIQNQVSYFPDNYIYTVICQYPKQKKVELVFGTDNSIKHLSVSNIANSEVCGLESRRCCVFVKYTLPPAVLSYFKNQKIEVVNKIPYGFKTDKLVFYDICPELICAALDHIDHVVIVYTRDDFGTLKEIYRTLENKSIEVPDFIQKIVG
ncbi:uncharacterized protein VICG_00705 [Vittaforma corneae ATCC 50505]|uniref:Uncharacterized protein n=1 Tax=Vittaforma corneae (strain ATCC 50505) TaxID=993615 RepID=L2GP63_VITCO|nr:uncharacterized protein VICG_00705 [Vittaforma corneae ATCC 50505]ELA42305.1 hypothetical protein VICG_00705 [Vittaforma corneae ATCC 50505]